jgi:hypothetical protein
MDGRGRWLDSVFIERLWLGYRTPAEVFTSCGMQPVVGRDWGSASNPGI